MNSGHLYDPQEVALDEIRAKRKEIELEEKRVKDRENLIKQQKELEERLDKLRLMPLHSNVLFIPYDSNPYKKKVNTSSGIILDWEGQFKNPDSGEDDRQQLIVTYGKVVEVGPDVKYTKVGDDIVYDTRVVMPVPFMDKGFYIIPEQNVKLIINEDLQERFKHIQ